MFKVADRLSKLPPYLFAELDRMKREAKARGMDIISLGIGDPDMPTPPNIVEKLKAAAADPANHQYPSYEGLLEFRVAVTQWYEKRFGVKLDPETEALSLIGSKEGIGHVALAFVEPGDTALIPDPAYPVYQAGTIFAGGQPVYMPLTEENGFLPDLNRIEDSELKRAKILYINYPNNPTAAAAELDFFSRVVDFARRHNILVCHDAAYSEIAFDGYEPHSFLEIDGAKDVGFEFHSLSKTFNMTGWRIGFAVGNSSALAGLGRIKTNLDSGVFQAVQVAGIEALRNSLHTIKQMREVYQKRRDALVSGLRKIGFEFEKPKASFYVWAKVPKGYGSMEFAARLLNESGVVVTPGVGFGSFGEGFFRMALTVNEERLNEAIWRISRVSF